MTKQKLLFEIGANYKKKKTEISHLHKYSDPLLNTLLKHIWQQLQHRVFPFFYGDHALSGWMGSVVAQLFSGLSRDVRSGSSPGHSRTFRALCCLGCVLRVIVLLEGEPSSQSEVLSALEQVFIKDVSVLCSVHLCLDPD